jgi:type VI protein secretion system component VasK
MRFATSMIVGGLTASAITIWIICPFLFSGKWSIGAQVFSLVVWAVVASVTICNVGWWAMKRDEKHGHHP